MTYSLSLICPPAAPPTSELYVIGARHVAPTDLKIHDAVFNLLDSIGKSFLFKEQANWPGSLKARVSLSPEKGVVIDSCNQPLFQIFMQSMKMYYIAVTRDAAIASKMLHVLQRTTVSQTTIEEVETAFKTDEVLYFDAHALKLHAEKLEGTATLDFELNVYHDADFSSNGKAASLRFPHLLLALNNRHPKLKNNLKAQICVIGPRLKELTNGRSFSPTLMELYALFPKARFCVLDPDPQIIAKLKATFKNQDVFYDPLMLKGYAEGFKASSIRPSQVYVSLFQQLYNELLSRSSQHLPHEVMPLNVDTRFFEFEGWDLLAANFSGKKKRGYDIIVAILSLSDAVNVQSTGTIDSTALCLLLSRYLSALKVNGSLYIDGLILRILKRVQPVKSIETVLDNLGALVGNKIECDSIPLNHFLPGALGNHGLIESATQEEAARTSKMFKISSTDVIALKRTSKKV